MNFVKWKSVKRLKVNLVTKTSGNDILVCSLLALKEVNHGQYVKTSPTSQVVNFILKISSSEPIMTLHFNSFQV